MTYIDFNLDGKIIKMKEEVSEEETGIIAIEKKDFDKTSEIKVLSKEDINSDTSTDIFGEHNE